MTVKTIRSAERVLCALEAVSEHQPIGIAALARILGDDKSALQRALATLHGAGWIRPAAGERAGWELTTRALVVGLRGERQSGLRARARPVLEALRNETGETTLLSVADGRHIVVLDVVEGEQLVRTAPQIGMTVEATTSAAGRSILAWMPSAALDSFLGDVPSSALLADLAADRALGWSLNDGELTPGARAVGAPILASDGSAVGSITISAPADRLPESLYAARAQQARAAAASISESP